MQQILLIFIKWSNLQKSASKFTPKAVFTLAKSSAIMPATATSDSSWVMPQKIGLFLFFVASPKVAKASTVK